MAWFCFENNGADDSGSSLWHIIDGETVTVRTRREYDIHGELLLEGDIVLEGTARLKMEN